MTRQFCTWCKEKPKAQSQAGRRWTQPGEDLPLLSPSTQADFPSNCPECNWEIVEGSDIGLRDEQWVCAACAREHDDIARAKQHHPSGGDHNASTR